MLEQPGCPNLYWALTNLPSPLIPLDKGMDGERVMHPWVFRDLNDSAPMSVEQIKKFIAAHGQDARDRRREATRKPGVRAWLDARTKDDAVVTRRPPAPRRTRPLGGAAAAVPGRPGDPPG